MTRTRGLSLFVLALAVSVVTPAAADTFLVYSEGGIPLGSDIAQWCYEQSLSGVCAQKPSQACDNPEGNEFWQTRTVNWSGFGFHRATCGGTNIHCWGSNDPVQGCNNPLIGTGQCVNGGLDLSAYVDGEIRFFIKTPVDIEVGIDVVGYGGRRWISDYGWVAPGSGEAATWQEIVMPVCAFFPNDECTAETAGLLSDVVYPFLATMALGGVTTLHEFHVDNVRWVTANSHAGPSSVQIEGRQLIVNGEPFVVNGVAYNPVSPCEDWRGAWRDRPERYLVDFPLIAASGANAVRVYAPLLTSAMLDAAWSEGLYMIPTFEVNLEQITCEGGREYQRDRLREAVLAWKDHPALLLWLIGNEVNTQLTEEQLCLDWYPYLDSLAQTIHEVEGESFHPVGTANADSFAVGDVCLAGCSDDVTLPNLDFWALHFYRGCSMASGFADYQAKPNCARPLIVGEFGADAWDAQLADESESMQSDCLATQLADADEALAVRTAGGVSSGQVIFEWSDEWWKSSCNPEAACDQDTCTDWINGAYPDSSINEEWWGLASIEGIDGDPNARGVRSAYDRVSESWRLGAVCDLEVVSHDMPSGDTTVSFVPAAGSTDHTLYYGPLTAVSSYGYSGSVSGLGATGSSSFTLPPGSLFWIVAAGNGGAEGCYGKDSADTERPCFPDSGGCSVAPAVYRTCQCPSP